MEVRVTQFYSSYDISFSLHYMQTERCTHRHIHNTPATVYRDIYNSLFTWLHYTNLTSRYTDSLQNNTLLDHPGSSHSNNNSILFVKICILASKKFTQNYWSCHSSVKWLFWDKLYYFKKTGTHAQMSHSTVCNAIVSTKQIHSTQINNSKGRNEINIFFIN